VEIEHLSLRRRKKLARKGRIEQVAVVGLIVQGVAKDQKTG
jgi:hypothetical protein